MTDYTINRAGTIEGPEGVCFQLRFKANGQKPVFRAYRDANGHVQTVGEALFDAQRLWHEYDAATMIVERARAI